jgi:hypothetical protein
MKTLLLAVLAVLVLVGPASARDRDIPAATVSQTLDIGPDSSAVFYFPHYLGRIPVWSYDVGVSNLLKFFTILPILVDDEYILFEAYSTSEKPERVTITIYYR